MKHGVEVSEEEEMARLAKIQHKRTAQNRRRKALALNKLKEAKRNQGEVVSADEEVPEITPEPTPTKAPRRTK